MATDNQRYSGVTYGRGIIPKEMISPKYFDKVIRKEFSSGTDLPAREVKLRGPEQLEERIG